MNAVKLNEITLNTVYNENCVETLKRIPSQFIDVVVTSPPYNMNLRIRNGEYCSRQIVKEFSSKYEGFDDNMPIDDFYEFHKYIIGELLRVSNLIFYNIQVVTGSKRAFFKIMGDYAEQLKEIIVWDKGYAQPAMSPGVLNRQSELLLVFDSHNAISRKFDHYNFDRGTLSDVWQIKRGKKIDQAHAAVFPEELVFTILKNFASPNGIVYDPFMGTGTTAVVAQKLGLPWIGSEMNPHYQQVALNRLATTKGIF